ncbi:Sensor histidine kinase [Pseudomonas chlororaphis]|uniref:Sensor histidine kinase n=1 Tax=Pseudomonas chlororaphis TaxID=587753 RepID=A0A3G7TN66_9PSED|nr:Sensor histidine kinase [Pseudomonas chlororaphis]
MSLLIPSRGWNSSTSRLLALYSFLFVGALLRSFSDNRTWQRHSYQQPGIYRRSAQILLKGVVPLYNASSALIEALVSVSKQETNMNT